MSDLIAEARHYIELAVNCNDETDRFTYLTYAADLLTQIEYLD